VFCDSIIFVSLYSNRALRFVKLLVIFTEIKCVHKKETLIVEIYGTVVSNSPNSKSTEILIKANQRPKYLIKFRFPNGITKPINYLTYNKIDYFILGGKALGENHLKQFPECND